LKGSANQFVAKENGVGPSHQIEDENDDEEEEDE
jgi:hypothetical protein